MSGLVGYESDSSSSDSFQDEKLAYVTSSLINVMKPASQENLHLSDDLAADDIPAGLLGATSRLPADESFETLLADELNEELNKEEYYRSHSTTGYFETKPVYQGSARFDVSESFDYSEAKKAKLSMTEEVSSSSDDDYDPWMIRRQFIK